MPQGANCVHLLLFFVSFMRVFKRAAFRFFSSALSASNFSSSFWSKGINSDALLKIVILAARSLSSNDGMLLRRHWKRFRRSLRRFLSKSLWEIRPFPSSFPGSDDSSFFPLVQRCFGGVFIDLSSCSVVSGLRRVVTTSSFVLSTVTLTTSISSSSVSQKEKGSWTKIKEISKRKTGIRFWAKPFNRSLVVRFMYFSTCSIFCLRTLGIPSVKRRKYFFSYLI